MAIRKDIRHEWKARYARGDGNCLWRSAAHALFGTDCFWRQLKLLSLAHAAAHLNEVHQHVLRSHSHYDNDIAERYAETEFLVLDDGTRVQIPGMARTDFGCSWLRSPDYVPLEHTPAPWHAVSSQKPWESTSRCCTNSMPSPGSIRT